MKYEVLDNKIIYKENNEILAEITFIEKEHGVFDINHTFVDERLRGKGIGKKLVEKAIEEIEKKNGKITASCSFANRIINGGK